MARGLSASETRAWIGAQTELLKSHLAGDRRREHVRSRMAEMFTRLKEFWASIVPEKAAGREFYAAADRKTLHVRMSGNGEPRLLLDANEFSRLATITQFRPAPDGRHVAYTVSPAARTRWSSDPKRR